MNPPMRPRIAIIGFHFQEYCLALANGLAASADVLLCVDAGRLSEEFEGRTMHVAGGVTVFDSTLDGVGETFAVLRAMRTFRPDVVHIQEPSGFRKAIVSGAVLLGSKGRVVALTVHDPVPHEGRDADIASRFAWVRRAVRRSADVVLLHGSFCREKYLEDAAKPAGQRVVLVDHGVILGGDPTPPSDDGPFALLNFGRMEQYKGIEILCSAAERLAAKGVQFSMRLAGRGPELDRLQARLCKMPQVVVDTRFIPAADLIVMMQQADCLVLPYISATQSGVVAAALANSRFVIASAVGDIPSIITDGVNGLLVPPGDCDALMAAIERVASDHQLRGRLNQGAGETASVRLNWNNIAEKTLAAYGLAERHANHN